MPSSSLNLAAPLAPVAKVPAKKNNASRRNNIAPLNGLNTRWIAGVLKINFWRLNVEPPKSILPDCVVIVQTQRSYFVYAYNLTPPFVESCGIFRSQ